MSELPDVQNSPPKIQRPIRQVGVEGIQVPFMLESRSGGFHETIATVSMRTDLAPELKGISMSRLHITLNRYLSRPLKRFLIKEILEDLVKSQDANDGYIGFQFKIPMLRKSPITDHTQFPIYYDCKFEGQLTNVQSDDPTFRFFQGAKIQYASYCPCSAELSKHLRDQGLDGFPHAQRSYVDVLTEIHHPHYVWLEDIIQSVEGAIKTLPYPIIKRVDEQEIARIAAENPIFVEDAIRQISEALDGRDDLYDWIIKCVHEESIHPSEAISINWKGIEGGFNGQFYI